VRRLHRETCQLAGRLLEEYAVVPRGVLSRYLGSLAAFTIKQRIARSRLDSGPIVVAALESTSCLKALASWFGADVTNGLYPHSLKVSYWPATYGSGNSYQLQLQRAFLIELGRRDGGPWPGPGPGRGRGRREQRGSEQRPRQSSGSHALNQLTAVRLRGSHHHHYHHTSP